MLSFSLFVVAINLISSELQDENSTNPFSFYCETDTGYASIDASWFQQESNTFYPENGINKRPKQSESISPSNQYDTYNANECQRIRRSWNSMNIEERSLYHDGLLKLREQGELNMNIDEVVAIASVHDSLFGSVTHHDSDYLFWHGYLVWELESRIRNLGGKFKCFGMPYWDITDEYDRIHSKQTNKYDPIPNIYKTGLGGFGDPDDYYKVNEYSWNIKTYQYWSPLKDIDRNCTATNDKCPICSLKRVDSGDDQDQFDLIASAEEHGQQILKNNKFIEFQQWMTNDCGLPHAIDNSYDPIWYLFHSMQSYYQAMWVNCNDYDLININDLEQHPQAFSPYCLKLNLDHDHCVGIDLDDPLYFGGVLPKRPWSFIHNEVLTIRKLYNLPEWNIVYDLNGDDFFVKSGLAKFCKNKLNEEWFILPTEEFEQMKESKDEKQQNLVPLVFDYDVLKVAIITFIVSGLLVMVYIFGKNNNKLSKANEINVISERSVYGTV